MPIVECSESVRPPLLRHFIDAFVTCLSDAAAATTENSAFVERLSLKLAAPTPSTLAAAGERPAACRHIPSALDALGDALVTMRQLAERFIAIEPFVPWSKRAHNGPDADRFAQGHANGLIVGPSGIERRDDIRVGVSIMAPQTRYPDHSHPPDELYLVLTEGEWWREGEAWFRPGPGGTVRNPPGILHAMRSGPSPLMAFWALVEG